MYPNLKLQIWKSGMRQNRVAQIVGIHDTLLSKIVNGFRIPDEKLRGRIATALQCDASWLFAESQPGADDLDSERGGELTKGAPG